METQDQTQSSAGTRNFYSVDKDLDLNGSTEDDEAYCRIKASGLEDTQPTNVWGQETMMYKQLEEGHESYKSVAMLQMDKMVETALPEDLESMEWGNYITLSSQAGLSRKRGGMS